MEHSTKIAQGSEASSHFFRNQRPVYWQSENCFLWLKETKCSDTNWAPKAVSNFMIENGIYQH